MKRNARFAVRAGRRKRTRRKASQRWQTALRLELLERRQLMDAAGLAAADDVAGADSLGSESVRWMPAAIEGRVWHDRDGSGTRDFGERGMGGVVVYSDLNYNGALDADEPFATTLTDDPSTSFDEGGLYRLGALTPGWHMVRQQVPRGTEQTSPSLPPGQLAPPWGDASAHVLYVAAGAVADGVDFGNLARAPGSVSGTKWLDRNGNGVREDEEPGLGGVVIYSDLNFNGQRDADEPATETLFDDPNTDADEAGRYRLGDLAAGFQTIREVIPEGYEQTFPRLYYPMPLIDVIVPPSEGFPIMPPNGWGPGAHNVTIEAGAHVEGLDFGNRPIEPARVSGVKWEDLNGNAVRDENEPGLAGVTIYLDLNFSGTLDDDEPRVQTAVDDPETEADETGRYQFDGLSAGALWIREVVPDGYWQTYPLAWPGQPLPIDLSAGEGLAEAAVRPIFWPGDGGGHWVFLGSGDDIEGLDFGNQRLEPSALSGVKWLDRDGDGTRDGDEPGLAGVTIYLDQNGNGIFDRGETATTTRADDPATDVDETGWYRFSELSPGGYVIRELVPEGYRQTYPQPPIIAPPLPPIIVGDAPADPFATVKPEAFALSLNGGEVYAAELSVAIHPLLFAPMEIDLIAPGADGAFVNHTGVLVNGGGGQLSTFQIEIMAIPGVAEFVIHVVDQSGGNVVAEVPVRIQGAAPRPSGAHYVRLGSGEEIAGLDFGNRRAGEAAVSGRKWLDRNGDGKRTADEPGLAGITIYADLNFNGVLDPGEPQTITRRDDPVTDFDEAGLYVLSGVPAGRQWIAEVVPVGFEATYPNNPVIAIFPPPPGAHVHEVTLEPGQGADGLDFGNRPVRPGSVAGLVWHDANGDGVRNLNERGMPGATVYADLNFNGRYDANEPHAVTGRDDPSTPENETGRYEFAVNPGWHAIRQVVPAGFRQTYPMSDAAVFPLEAGAHYVEVESGSTTARLQFGNRQVVVLPPYPMPGDHNADGSVDGADMKVWETTYGAEAMTAPNSQVDFVGGASLLAWQRNFGQQQENADGTPIAEATARGARPSAAPLSRNVWIAAASDSGPRQRTTARPAGRGSWSAGAADAAFAGAVPNSWQAAPTGEFARGAASSRESLASATRPTTGSANVIDAASLDAAWEAWAD